MKALKENRENAESRRQRLPKISAHLLNPIQVVITKKQNPKFELMAAKFRIQKNQKAYRQCLYNVV
jgi:hypothetical protein